MLRKALLSSLIVLFSVFGVVFGVLAQTNAPQTNVAQIADDEDAPVVAVQPVVGAATVVQSVPVTLTLTIPGPTGPFTVEVPIFLSLDIRIGISPELTTTLEVTPSVVTVVTPVATGTVTSPAAATATPLPTTVPTAIPTTAPTAVPTVAPTATTAPETEAEPTEVPLPTPTATTEPEPVVVAPACSDPRSLIVAPGVGQVVSGVVNILGTATHENFQYYKLEYAPGTDVDPNDTFAFLGDSRAQVTGAVLGSFDSTNYDNGPYTIKLTVVDNSGNFPPPCTVSIVIEN